VSLITRVEAVVSVDVCLIEPHIKNVDIFGIGERQIRLVDKQMPQPAVKTRKRVLRSRLALFGLGIWKKLKYADCAG